MVFRRFKSKSNTVLEIKAGNLTVTGQEIRAALSLRSASFDIEYDDGFKITTRGYGHCVGMSQYGANAMAKEGQNIQGNSGTLLSQYRT